MLRTKSNQLVLACLVVGILFSWFSLVDTLVGWGSPSQEGILRSVSPKSIPKCPEITASSTPEPLAANQPAKEWNFWELQQRHRKNVSTIAPLKINPPLVVMASTRFYCPSDFICQYSFLQIIFCTWQL